MKKLNLAHEMFHQYKFKLFESDQFTVETFKYKSGVEALSIKNDRGELVILPFMGMIIWDAIFDGVSLKMKDMFSQPLPGQGIEDTYGCFQFSSGLLGNGTPSPEDDYQLHGEFPTATMDSSYIEVGIDTLTIHADYEYVKGFGDHYLAEPSVKIYAGSGLFDIGMSVSNLSKAQAMPLQYMCHMNYAYVDQAFLSQNVPDKAFKLRETIPAHVHPNKEWLAYNEKLRASGQLINKLSDSKNYDPEIVFFSENLTKYIPTAEFRMAIGNGHQFLTRFDTEQLPIVTRWLLYNADQQVAAFALPGTNTPEGRTAAKSSGNLTMLQPGEKKTFSVTTGLEY